MTDKEIITIAADSGSVGLEQAVVDFNAVSEQYWIEIVDYYQRYSNNIGVDMETYEANLEAADLRIRAEILAGEGPDMIIGDFQELSDYRRAGMLMDLMPMIESGESIQPEEMVASIWNACMEGESLYIAPLEFCVHGMYASKEYFGDRTGITFEDNATLVSGAPDNVIYSQGNYYSGLLSNVLPYSMDTFVDFESGTVDFDNPQLGELLKFVKEYGIPEYDPNEEMVMDEEFVDYETLWPRGKLMIFPYVLSTPSGYADMNRMSPSGATFSGYPSTDASGPMGYVFYSVAIVDKENVSEGCRLFYNMLFTEDIQKAMTVDDEKYMYYNFPILESLFEDYLLMPQEKTPRTNWFMVEAPQKITKADADAVRDIINGITEIYVTYPELEQIILEEAMPYINDQKTLEEVLPLIQNRVSLYVAERGGF